MALNLVQKSNKAKTINKDRDCKIKESQILVKTLSTLLHFIRDPRTTTPDSDETIKSQNAETKQYSDYL